MSWKFFVAAGRVDEAFVAKQLLEQMGGRVTPATNEEDIYSHVDFWWDNADGNRVGVDVKGMKKRSRYDSSPDNDITWLELQNVNGKPGWLYGSAKYIAFRRTGITVFVDRNVLVDYAERLIAGKQVVTVRPQVCGVPYTRSRWNRNDITVMVPLDEVQKLAEFCLANA